MSESKTVGAGVAGAAALGLIIIMVAHVLPDRMPPDPFDEHDEPRAVLLEVAWEGEPRYQLIAYDAGDDEGEVRAGPDDHLLPGEGQPTWAWDHVTTARPGTTVRLSSVQGARGLVTCSVYADDVLIDSVPTEDRAGCFAEVVIP